MKRLLLFLIFVLCADVCVAGVSDAPRKSEFEKALKVVLTTVAPQTPIAAVDDRIKKYEDMQAHKGLAIEPITGRSWRSQSHEDKAVAGARTLEGCQLRYGRPCALIAVNEEIVLEGPLVPKDMPRLHYAGKFDLAQIPMIKSARTTAPDLQNYAQMPEPKVIVIHPWGRVFISQISQGKSMKELEETVLAKCNNDPERAGQDGDCFIYAINNDVVLSKRFASPKRTSLNF